MRLTKSFVMVGASLAMGALLLAACSSTSSPGATKGIPTGGSKVAGGTVRWAEPPSAPPNYIWPFMSLQDASVDNISQFQYIMYRPLYYFGAAQSTSTALNTTVSLAQPPVYSDNGSQAVINLKSYKWSNGEAVDANDVLFFLNLLHAEKANFYAYLPGTIPDNITNVTVNSPTQLTIKFNNSYNSFWMTYNQFSEITPFPKAWDIKATGDAAGSGGCSTGTFGASSTDAACTAVYTYLNGQAGNLASYDSNPIWGVVDGPFTIASSKGGSFDSSGDVTMVPNASYSGPVKPTISKFEEVPFTTDDAEYD
ncbi:MAG: ABC transporter substrate-binding protein, partial [Nitrososphaerales archaeon]